MDARKVVQEIKVAMSSHARSGEASRLRGIIVTPKVYQALKEDSGNFHGVIGVSGREGNRILRYVFYVLENPNFPKKATDSFFFVGYPKEIYEKRYLGREDEILASGHRREEKVGRVKIREVNPVLGIITVNKRYFYNVDFVDVLTEAKKIWTQHKDIEAHLCSLFDRNSLVHNVPETKWIMDEPTYNYEKADTESSVGRLLMKRVETSDRWHPHLYQIVGIGLNGYGDIVELVMEKSKRYDPYEFACFAVHFFLPEEVADFLNQYGIKITAEWIAQVPVTEHWGAWFDPEGIGRLRCLYWYRGDKKGHEISGGFIGSRGKEYEIKVVKIEGEDGWPEIKAKYFPPGWERWPDTAKDKRIAAFAQTL